MHFDDAIAVTPSDTVNDPALPGCGYFTGFYVGGAGDVKITTPGGNNTVLKAALVGKWYPIAFLRVWSTGTTATNVVGLVQAA